MYMIVELIQIHTLYSGSMTLYVTIIGITCKILQSNMDFTYQGPEPKSLLSIRAL